MTLSENTSREALLPEWLKRKHPNVKRQDENHPAQLRTSQPWRPGGCGAAVVGAKAQDRPVLSQQQASVLTSMFSVRDSLQSLRSSRVFKQAGEPVEHPKPEPTKQHARPTGNTRDRPVLQPLGTQQHRVGASSRASSCGSNSALQAQPSHRTSCSSLDSAVNQVLSPTDESGRFCIAGPGRSAQAAESKQSLPAAVSASLRIPQVADSCCELLQMEEQSPTCSRAASSSCENPVPVRPVQAPAPSKPAAAPVASKPAVRSQPAARSTLPPQAHTAAGKAVSRAAVVAPVGKGPAPAPKPWPRVGSAAPVLPNRIPAAAAKQQRRRVGEAAASVAGAGAKKAGHGLGLRRAAAAGAPKQQHVEHRQTAAAVGQPVGMLDATLQQRVHHVVEQPAAQEAALCQACDGAAPPLSLPTEWSRVVQPPQVQQEASEIVDMRNKLLAMQQQLAALQQQVGQRPALQAPAAPAVQEPLPPATTQQQQQQEEEEASTGGGDSSLHDALPLQDGSDLQQQHDSGNMDNAAACAGSTVQTQGGLLPPAQSQQEQQQDADQRVASAGAELQKDQQGDCCKEQHQDPVQQQQGAVHVPGEQQQQENVGQQQPPAFQQQQQQPNTRHFGAAVTNSQLLQQQQQQQQSSTYHKLLQATRALVNNSHWQATSLQMRPGCPSPLKAGCSSGRLGGGLGRSAAVSVLGGSPALSKQLSRLSVSQSWGGASPGPTPRPGPAPADLPQLDTRAGASAAGLGGEAVRARLFGPAFGAVPGALLESQSSPAAVDKAMGSLGAGCGSIATLGHQVALPQPDLTVCSSPFHSGAFSSRGLSAAAAAAHQQLNTIPPPLCTSRVAQVLYGTPSKQPLGLPTSETAGHNSDKQQRTGGCSGSMAAAEGVGCSAAATGCRHVGETASQSWSGVASQPDSDDETDSGRQPQGDVQRCRLQAPGQQNRSLAASAGGKPSQQTAGLTGSYEQQQEMQEWTVHTNWAADLDAETAAVAAAASAAAGLSAQLGRGHAVRLQDHSSPFNPAQLHCAGSSVHGSPPVWVSVGGMQQQQQSHPEVGASPVSLMVPRKLWSCSPPRAEAGE